MSNKNKKKLSPNQRRSQFTSTRDGWNFLRTRTTPTKQERINKKHKKHKKKYF